MANRNLSNTNSSDDDEETLYQINHSRPSSRVSTVSSLKSASSKTSIHSVGFQQTIPSYGYFIRAHKNKLDRERTHRILQNSDRNDLHAIDDHSKSNRLDRERTHRILEGSNRDNVRIVDKHHHSRQENQIPVDVERESTHRSLTPVVVIQNPRTKRNENKTLETINPKYQKSNDKRTREARPTTESVALENYTGSVTEIDYQIKQLTFKIDELKKQIKTKETRRDVEHRPSTKERRDMGESDADENKESHEPPKRTMKYPNLTHSFSTGKNREARGLSDQPIFEQSLGTPRSEFVSDPPLRVSSGNDKTNRPWAKRDRPTVSI